MMQILEVIREEPRPCSYLPGASARLVHAFALDVPEQTYDELLAEGKRRFGLDYFFPDCPSCRACTPTRVPVQTFQPSASERRVRRRGERLRAEWGTPRVDQARLDLYERWHREREQAREWDSSEMSERQYRNTFVAPVSFARELTLWQASELVCVSLYDETPTALSAVYCFHDPRLSRDSLGTQSILRLIERARETGKTHLYLGYWVKECPSLAYKARFRPQERYVDGSWVATPADAV
jgi:leucyl-tRNA---protein transferase